MTTKTKKATKKAGPNTSMADLGDIFKDTAEQDAEDTKLAAVLKRVKRCQLLTQEIDLMLRAASKETATHEIIEIELKRVLELTCEMSDEAVKAVEGLGL